MATTKELNAHHSLLFLAGVMEMEIGSQMKVGFAEITRIDTNTFTVSNIDEEEYVGTIENEGLVDEITIKSTEEES